MVDVGPQLVSSKAQRARSSYAWRLSNIVTMNVTLLYIFFIWFVHIHAQVLKAVGSTQGEEGEDCHSGNALGGNDDVQRLTPSTATSSNHYVNVSTYVPTSSTTAPANQQRLPLHDQEHENWVHLKDSAAGEIEHMLKQLVQVGEESLAGRLAWQLLQRLDAPRGKVWWTDATAV